MPRRILMVAAILPLLAGCRDGPTTPIAPLEDGVVAAYLVERAQALSMLHDMFADRFMHELIETAGAPSLGRGFDVVAASAARGDILSASRALATTRHVLRNDVGGTGDDQDHDLAILRDVLELLLSDAEEVLHPALLDREQRLDLPRQY